MSKVIVQIIESEAGWGQRVDETKVFTSTAKAEAFVKRYNARNNLPQVPSWYMYAQIVSIDGQPTW